MTIITEVIIVSELCSSVLTDGKNVFDILFLSHRRLPKNYLLISSLCIAAPRARDYHKMPLCLSYLGMCSQWQAEYCKTKANDFKKSEKYEICVDHFVSY